MPSCGEDSIGRGGGGSKRGSKKRSRPMHLLRSILESTTEHVESTTEPDPTDDGLSRVVSFRNEKITSTGHLLKWVSLPGVELNVQPSFDEILAFNPKKAASGGDDEDDDDAGNAGPTIDVSAVGASRVDLAAKELAKGDTVTAISI